MHRSHKTQELLNYFDEKDSRVREHPYTTDAQLLNGVAVQLEDAELRLTREIDARTLQTCPVHLDNRGVYRAVRLENDVELSEGQTEINLVGVRNGQQIPLAPFDDRLPVPSSYVFDDSRKSVALSDPVLFDITGDGDAQNQVWNVQTFGPAELEIPNRLTFYVEGVAGNLMGLNIFVEGQTDPVPVWMRDRRSSSESLSRYTEGAFITSKVWAKIERITVRGLPQGVRLRCWKLPFNLPATPDADRPYSHAAYRGTQFDRYWMLSPSENLVKEMFLMDNLSGLEVANTYQMPLPLSALAVEPRTWGLLTAGGSVLMYSDRREPMPDKTHVTALTREPLYGLDCQYNFTLPGAVRYLYIRPVAYGRAKQLHLWRYLVEDPSGTLQALLPDGSLVEYSGGAGWQRGTPKAVNLPLVQTGTYVITMETLDEQNVLASDSFPYVNLALSGKQFDLSALVPEIQGIAYDSRENLWIWTGDYAVPLRPTFDNYILDAANRTLYLTADYDELNYA